MQQEAREKLVFDLPYTGPDMAWMLPHGCLDKEKEREKGKEKIDGPCSPDFLFTLAEIAAHTTNGCIDMECMICAIRDCPHGEPLHYHHDGCPSCLTA